MTREEAIEIICDDYCKFPDIESGNRLADICDSCPFNKCEDLRWADAVDVVRCKDCKHRDLFSCPLTDNDFQKDEDYCSWGERKGGNTDG